MKVLGCTEKKAANLIVTELKLPISEEQYLDEVREILRKTLINSSLMPGTYFNSVLYVLN